jgi:hypothetical protein
VFAKIGETAGATGCRTGVAHGKEPRIAGPSA